MRKAIFTTAVAMASFLSVAGVAFAASPQTWIKAAQDNALNQGDNSCDTGGLFLATGTTPFTMTALNGYDSVYTPACLRDPYIRLYFGTYYLLYSEGETYLDIATSSSLTSGWAQMNRIAIGSGSPFGVNVPGFAVDPSGVVHVTVWDYPDSEWYEIHPPSSDPSTWAGSWSTKGNLYDTSSSTLPGTENLYITQYNGTYYLEQSVSNTIQIRTSNNVVTGWSAASSNLSIPGAPSFLEGEVPTFLGNDLAVSWANDNSDGQSPYSYSVNSSGSSGSWGSPIQVAPLDYYAETTPDTDMACGPAGQYYQPPVAVAPASNLCAVGGASAVTMVGGNWVWTCTLGANVAMCNAPAVPSVVSVTRGIVAVIKGIFTVQ